MSSLLAPAFEVEVIEFLAPLIVFADGVKLRLRHDGIQFSANYCSFSAMEYELSQPARPTEERLRIYHDHFPRGKKLLVQAFLDDCSAAKGSNVRKRSQATERSIVDYAQLDWKVVGKVVAGPVNDELLVDCGIPILTFGHSDLQVGDWGEWIGELRLWDYHSNAP
jgi:hypothetical protein